MTDRLGAMFDQLDRRLLMAEAMQCRPETVTVLREAFYAVHTIEHRVLANRRVRLRRRAEDLGWSPCDIHAKYSGRPTIDCHFCQRANKPGQG